MIGAERRFAFGDLLANQLCVWAPASFRHYPGILAGNSIGMAMTNGYVCGQGSWRCRLRNLMCRVSQALMYSSTYRPVRLAQNSRF